LMTARVRASGERFKMTRAEGESGGFAAHM
jgi:hypothetical protein